MPSSREGMLLSRSHSNWTCRVGIWCSRSIQLTRERSIGAGKRASSSSPRIDKAPFPGASSAQPGCPLPGSLRPLRDYSTRRAGCVGRPFPPQKQAIRGMFGGNRQLWQDYHASRAVQRTRRCMNLDLDGRARSLPAVAADHGVALPTQKRRRR